MMLNEFDNMLKNLANDRMLMSYGNNLTVVNNLISVVNYVHGLSGIIQTDRMNDMFAMSLGSKMMELENIVVMLGTQRLMACGLMGGASGGMPQPMSPIAANTPMYNQQMYYPMMNNMQMQQPMQMPQMQMPQMPQMQQPMPQVQPAAAPPPMPPQSHGQPAPQSPIAPPARETGSAPSGSTGGGVTFGFPGMGGGGSNEKAEGRDYLLKLLSEK